MTISNTPFIASFHVFVMQPITLSAKIAQFSSNMANMAIRIERVKAQTDLEKSFVSTLLEEKDADRNKLDAAEKIIDSLERELEELRKRIKELEEKKPGFWNCFSLPPQV